MDGGFAVTFRDLGFGVHHILVVIFPSPRVTGMLNQDANSTTAPQVSGDPEPNAVAQWKSSVQEFFSREWDSLRDLIRKLEEHDWDGATLSVPSGKSESVRPFHERVVSEIAAEAQANAQLQAQAQAREQTMPELPAAPDTSRLADLAKRIENQLKRKAGDV